MRKAVKIRAFGTVQGVWFRKNTQEKAFGLNISGFVKNQDDGSVYIEAEGEESDLNQFVNWCNSGPEKAIVLKIDVSNIPLQHDQKFQIRT